MGPACRRALIVCLDSASPVLRGLIAILLLSPLFSVSPAVAGSDERAVTRVTDVTSHRFDDGAPAGLGYTIRQEALETVQPDQDFPSVRIAADEYPDEFEGQWGDSGFHAAWVAPKGRMQFMPDAYSVESAYFDNYLWSDAQPMEPGDGADIAVKTLPADAILTWDTQRTTPSGEPEWEVATHAQTISATYGGVSQTAELLFVRADLVVRGGDFDAKDGADLPPLVVDLGKTYGPEIQGSATTAAFAPYLHYVRNLEGQVLPQSGKAVFSAKARGYLPEARAYDLPGETHIREWHIPLNIIITLTKQAEVADPPGELPFGPRSMVQMPSEGKVWSTVGSGTTSLAVPAGTSVVTAPGSDPLVLRSAADSDVPSASSTDGTTVLEQGSASRTLMDDVRATASIDHHLDEPVRVEVGKRTFGFTVDPDFKDQGLLALRSFDHSRSGQTYFQAAAAPFVRMDGELYVLDRSRLVDLRVLPLFDPIRIRFTGRSDGSVTDPFSYLKAREGRILRTGVVVEAVYRLTDDRYAFFTAYGHQDADAGDGVPAISTYLDVRSLSHTPAHGSVVRYMETGDDGPISVGGTAKEMEFSGPAGLVKTETASIGMGIGGGAQLTGVRSPASLTPDPVADPDVSLAGSPVGLYLTSRDGTTSWIHGGSMSSALQSVPETPSVPLPLGDEPCIEPAVTDDDDDDAAEHLDIERAWFDFDGRRLHATIKVASLPEASVGRESRYRASFRHEHIGFGMEARRDIAGEWSFVYGLHPSAGSPMSTTFSTVGEVLPGTPGLIRMSIPMLSKFSGAGFLDGETLRDTGAVSFDVGPTGTVVADRAPESPAEYAYGRGNDYLIALCPGLTHPTTLDLLGSASEGQYSDEVELRARLADHTGSPVVDRSITFTVAGERDYAVTDSDGIARVAPKLTGVPGAYELDVSFVGDDSYQAAVTSGPFTILREDSAVTMDIAGRGSQRILSLILFDEDSTEGIAGRSIEIYADGVFVETVETDREGRAVSELGPRHRGGHHLFEAKFLGDTYFLGSDARIRS